MKTTTDYEQCPLCKGKGKVTYISDTNIKLGAETINLDSTKGETEVCPKCNGSGQAKKIS